MIWSFKLGFILAMKLCSNTLRASFLLGVLQMTFQLKLWSILSLKYFAGFDLLLGVLCSIHLISMFPWCISRHKYIFVCISYMLDVMVYLLIEKKFLLFWSTIIYSNIKITISEVIKLFNKLFGRYLIFDTKKYLS